MELETRLRKLEEAVERLESFHKEELEPKKSKPVVVFNTAHLERVPDDAEMVLGLVAETALIRRYNKLFQIHISKLPELVDTEFPEKKAFAVVGLSGYKSDFVLESVQGAFQASRMADAPFIFIRAKPTEMVTKKELKHEIRQFYTPEGVRYLGGLYLPVLEDGSIDETKTKYFHKRFTEMLEFAKELYEARQ